jgi:transglutaminase-like putative cysteine protease
MIAALRSRGIATRFGGGNTHAWVQAHIPGSGWIDFDPSRGVVGNQNLVRVAVAQVPRSAIPLQGTWYGKASDHAAMRVAVRVKEPKRTGNFIAIRFLMKVRKISQRLAVSLFDADSRRL